MNTRTGPAVAARRILEAFQTRKVGAEITLIVFRGDLADVVCEPQQRCMQAWSMRFKLTG